MALDHLNAVEITEAESKALTKAMENNRGYFGMLPEFDAVDRIRLVAYRRATRKGFYNDAIPASVVIDGLMQMLESRKQTKQL